MIFSRIFKIMVLLLLEAPCLLGQKEDYHWILGYNLFKPTSDTTYGRCEFIFSDISRKIIKSQNTINKLDFTNASISDSLGNLLFYTNGLEVYNRNYQVMPNGDDLNPGEFATNNEDLGYTLIGGAIILPWPDHNNMYFIIHHTTERDFVKQDWHAGNMLTTLVDMNLNNGLGDVIYKNKSIFADSLSRGGLTACRHANGRDWWLICPYYSGKKIFTFLLDPSGLKYNDTQSFPFELMPGTGQSTFSPDGTKYSFFHFTNTDREFFLCDFDRCNGQLSNMQFDYYPQFDFIGVAFSPNSKYLYLSTGKLLYQLDMDDSLPFNNKIKIDTIDGFISEPSAKVPSYLTFMQLAPDGKIYIFNGRSTEHLSTIWSPNNKGTDCDLRQHNILIIHNSTIPNFPYYRLSALKGSDCDTLNKVPVADWNYLRDSANHRKFKFIDNSKHEIIKWNWNFDDPINPLDTSNEQNPVYSFSADGLFNVCLIVENNIAKDTLCKTLNIKTVSSKLLNKSESIQIAPNPFEDLLIIKILVNNSAKMTFYIYNQLGVKIISNGLTQGPNVINTKDLISGLYYLTICENAKIIKQEIILKYHDN